MIIGISGKKQSGKSTVAKIIHYLIIRKQYGDFLFKDYDEDFHESGWETKMFAYKIKQCVSFITGIPIEELEKEEVKNSLIGKDWDDITYRLFMQKFGSDVVRSIHRDVWVNALFAEHTEDSNWIISDLRYENELQAIKDRGGITIRLSRISNSTDTHPSETALDNAEFDWYIHNFGTIEQLVEKIRLILKTEGII